MRPHSHPGEPCPKFWKLGGPREGVVPACPAVSACLSRAGVRVSPREAPAISSPGTTTKVAPAHRNLRKLEAATKTQHCQKIKKQINLKQNKDDKKIVSKTLYQ